MGFRDEFKHEMQNLKKDIEKKFTRVGRLIIKGIV